MGDFKNSDLEDLKTIEKLVAASSRNGMQKTNLKFLAQCTWGIRNFVSETSSLGPFQQWTAEDIVRVILSSDK
jgi:hypothetical protein